MQPISISTFTEDVEKVIKEFNMSFEQLNVPPILPYAK